MDGDFQQQYQDAERAYGEGDYTAAHRLASGLLEQLVDQPQDPEAQAAVLGWRAFVALLLWNGRCLGDQGGWSAQRGGLILQKRILQHLRQ